VDLADLAVFAFGPFVVLLLATWAAGVDDTFITLRYAANFVHGHGLVFNPGVPVQGFTSPLGLVMAIGAYLLPGGHAFFKMKLASSVLAALGIGASARLLAQFEPPRWAARTCYLAVGSSWVVAYAAGNGLETSLEMLLLTLVADAVLRHREPRCNWRAAVLAALAVFTRIDAILPLTAMAVVDLALASARPLTQRARWFAGALGALGATLLGELAYFHSLLPSTFYAKQRPLGSSLDAGIRYLWDAPSVLETASHPTLVALVAVVQLALLVLGVGALRRHRGAALLVAAVVGQVLFIVYAGGDWMIGDRFLAPVVPMLIIVQVLGVSAAVAARGTRTRRRGVPLTRALLVVALVGAGVAPLAVAWHPVTQITNLSDAGLLAAGGDTNFSGVWAQLTDTLDCIPDGSVVAASEVGYLGFERLGLRVIDLRGLNDLAIAKAAPAGTRSFYGVSDHSWYLSTDPIGRILLRIHPAVIVEFDSPPPAEVLGGTYRLAKIILHHFAFQYYVPTHSRTPPCLR
jgi:hypothetical protein